jgi:predicted nucleotidyltransferase
MKESYVFKKGRKRLYTGKLDNFNSLDKETQDTFKLIKKEIKTRIGKDVNVYVFGSYFWGYADEGSDFDVRIDNVDLTKVVNLNKISNRITKKTEKLTHVVYVDKERVFDEGILIP